MADLRTPSYLPQCPWDVGKQDAFPAGCNGMVVGCAWCDRESFPGKEVTSGVEHRDMLKERLGAGDLRVAFFVCVF